MYGQLTTAQLRDAVRRDMGMVPPVDDGEGKEGDQPTVWKWPTNALLTQKIREGYAWVSRKTRAGGDHLPLSYAVTAQTDPGPYALDLGLITPAGSVNEVKRAAWIAAGSSEYPLIPDDRDRMDRNRIAWASQEPSTPQRFWVEEGYLLLYPAPSAAGTLTLMLDRELGWQDTNADSYYLTVLPSEHFPTLVAYIVWATCATQPDDSMWAEFGKAALMKLLPERKGGMGGEDDMAAFFQRRSRSYQANLQADVGRIPYHGAGGRR